VEPDVRSPDVIGIVAICLEASAICTIWGNISSRVEIKLNAVRTGECERASREDHRKSFCEGKEHFDSEEQSGA
jgi:hypothetical protein